jgi:hypothetical protein
MGFNASQLAQAAAILQVGGALNSAIGGYYGAKSQQSGLRFQADIADVNARIAELGAQSALDRGQRQVGALTLQAGRLKSRQRAAMAANGIDLGVGSAAEVQASTDIMKEIDVDTIIANAVRTAWGYRVEATNYQNDAMMKRATARTISPLATGVASLLGSAGSVASTWYRMNRSGLIGKTFDDNYQVGTLGYSGNYLEYDR